VDYFAVIVVITLMEVRGSKMWEEGIGRASHTSWCSVLYLWKREL